MKRSKRILSAILTVLMLVSAFSGFVLAVDETEVHVTDKSGLVAAIADNAVKTIYLDNDIVLNAGVTYEYDSANKNVTVTKDGVQIAVVNATDGTVTGDLSSLTAWTPVSLNGKTLDGQNHSIIGFYANTPGATMFTAISADSKVCNLKVVNAFTKSNAPTSGDANISILAGYLRGEIENVDVKDAVVLCTPTDRAWLRVGGVVARVEPTFNAASEPTNTPFAKNITFSGDVVVACKDGSGDTQTPSTGGVVGQLYSQGSLLNCANYGNVTVLSARKVYSAGGVVGIVEINGRIGVAKVQNCANYGTIQNRTGRSTTDIGGVIGYCDISAAKNPSTVIFENLYNEGNVQYWDSTKEAGKELVNAGGGIIGRETGCNTASNMTSDSKAAYAYNETDAKVGKRGDFKITNSQISTLSAYTAMYRLNCNAGNIPGAYAWKVVDGKAVIDFGTVPEEAKEPENYDNVDKRKFDVVKYYNEKDEVYNLSALSADVADATTDSTGKWKVFNDSKIFVSNTVGNSVEIQFEGTGIEMYTGYRWKGNADFAVYLDGELIETVSSSSYSPDEAKQGDYVVYGVYDLVNTLHSLRVLQLTSSNFAIQKFAVYGENAVGIVTEAREFDGYEIIDNKTHLHKFKDSDGGFVGYHTNLTKSNQSICTICELQVWVDAADYDYIVYYDANHEHITPDRLDKVIEDGKKYDDKNSRITEGGWGYYGASSYFKSNAFRTNTQNASFEITFDGTGIEWHTNYRGSNMADVKITLDGVEIDGITGSEISENNATYDRKVFELHGLPDTRHTLCAENEQNTKLMLVDYFVIEGKAVKTVLVPDPVKGLVYNGEEQSGIATSDDYTATENGTKTNAGEYTATVELEDKVNTVWEGGNVSDKSVDWSIARAPVTVKADDQSKNYGEDDPEFTVTVTGTFNEDEVTYNSPYREDESEDVGDYVITVTVDEEDQGNYYVICENGTLTVGHEHTPGDDWMSNSEAHWHACGTTCPIGTTVEEYEAAFEENPGLMEILEYREHHFGGDGCCEECNDFYALPDYGTELEVKNITYSDNTISVAFNVPYDSVDMHDAAKLAVYATSEDIDELVELKQPQNELLENEGYYVLTYDEETGDAIVTFDYGYKFVSIGIKNSNIELNPMEFFMLDDGVEDDDDEQETKLGNWITCNAVVDGAPKSEFDFVFFTTTGKEFRYDSALLNSTIDGYETKYDTYSDYLDSFGNAILIDSELLTSKYLRVAGLEQEYSTDIAFYLVAQDVGGMLGYQEKLGYSNYHRILAPITIEEAEAIDDYVTVVGYYGDNFENEINYTIDCAYTAYYADGTLYDVATTISGAFAVIIIDNEDRNGFSGPVYLRIYNGDELLRDGVYIPELYQD